VAIEFNTSLSEGDWDERLGGWRCEALLIPSASVISIYYNGAKADTKSYSVEGSNIRWSDPSIPKEVVVRLFLSKDLIGLEEEKLKLEKEKLALEHQKVRIENKWKIIAAVGATLSFLLTFLGTRLFGQPTPTTSSTPIARETFLGEADLTKYCQGISSNPNKSEVKAIPDDKTDNGWLCRDYGIPPIVRKITEYDLDEACRKQYKKSEAHGNFSDKKNRYTFECWSKK
jgi:hypothetical protein